MMDRFDHIYLGEAHGEHARRAQLTIGLTFAMMVAEIAGGMIFNSMALLADGWHMATHAGALTIAVLAYGYAQRYARDPRFSFGTGKIGDLSGFTSAVILAFISILIAWQSTDRLLHPLPIGFSEAVLVAILGLVVNLASAWLLGGDHHHHGHDHNHAHAHDDHHHHHDHDHEAHHHANTDHNLRAAYMHVMADALTSVLAIVALLMGWRFGWVWMDPLMGIVGSLVILRWSLLLMRDTARVLVDVEPDTALGQAIQDKLRNEAGARVTDMHLWRVGPGHLAAIIALESAEPQSPEYYKGLLSHWTQLAHVNVEITTVGQK